MSEFEKKFREIVLIKDNKSEELFKRMRDFLFWWFEKDPGYFTYYYIDKRTSDDSSWKINSWDSLDWRLLWDKSRYSDLSEVPCSELDDVSISYWDLLNPPFSRSLLSHALINYMRDDANSLSKEDNYQVYGISLDILIYYLIGDLCMICDDNEFDDILNIYKELYTKWGYITDLEYNKVLGEFILTLPDNRKLYFNKIENTKNWEGNDGGYFYEGIKFYKSLKEFNIWYSHELSDVDAVGKILEEKTYRYFNIANAKTIVIPNIIYPINYFNSSSRVADVKSEFDIEGVTHNEYNSCTNFSNVITPSGVNDFTKILPIGKEHKIFLDDEYVYDITINLKMSIEIFCKLFGLNNINDCVIDDKHKVKKLTCSQ